MRKLALLVIVLLVGPGCSAPRSSPPSVTAPTPLADGAQAATVNRILAGLDAVMGDLQRVLVRERRITSEVTDRLRAIYTGPELLNQIDAFRADVAGGLTGYKDPPGNRITMVSRLITASPVCVFVEVTRDYGPISVRAAPRPVPLYVVLVAKTEAEDPRQLNPTPWAMLYDGVQEDGAQPEDICR